jgi:hypothetical protein
MNPAYKAGSSKTGSDQAAIPVLVPGQSAVLALKAGQMVQLADGKPSSEDNVTKKSTAMDFLFGGEPRGPAPG